MNKNEVLKWRDTYNKFGVLQLGSDIFDPQLKEYIQSSSRLINQSKITADEQNEGVVKSTNPLTSSRHMYSHFLSESILFFLTPLYSEITQKKLIPTYSIFRTYHKGNFLVPHQDRPSCQYSATIQIDASEDKPWPIEFYSLDRKIMKSKGNIFEIVFYQGENVLHWRKQLEYESSSHIFLHWVDGNDPIYKDYHYDGRKFLLHPP